MKTGVVLTLLEQENGVTLMEQEFFLLRRATLNFIFALMVKWKFSFFYQKDFNYVILFNSYYILVIINILSKFSNRFYLTKTQTL